MRLSLAPRVVARGASVVLVLFAVAGAAQTKPRSYVVDIASFQFAPAHIVVAVGDTLIWANHDIVPHTATAVQAGWDSGAIATDRRRSVVVRETGRFEYRCTLHPTMKGTVVVR